MPDSNDNIPTDGIFYSEAFERFFDAVCPDAAKLRAALGQVSVVSGLTDEDWLAAKHRIQRDTHPNDYDAAWDRWDAARKETQTVFRNELATGVLDIYRRDRKEHPSIFESSAFMAEVSDENPAVYFKKADFEKWLRDIQGKKKKGSPALEQAKIALNAVFGTKIPDSTEMRNGVLCQRVRDWIKKERPEWQFFSDDTLLRAAGRKS